MDINEKINELLENSEFIKYMEIEFTRLDEEEAVAKIPFKSKFLNAYGSVHGGLLYAIADTVAGAQACMSGSLCTTVDGAMNYFEPAVNTEYIYCIAKRVRCGKHLVNVKVEIKDDDGKLLDDGSFNYFRITQKS